MAKAPVLFQCLTRNVPHCLHQNQLAANLYANHPLKMSQTRATQTGPASPRIAPLALDYTPPMQPLYMTMWMRLRATGCNKKQTDASLVHNTLPPQKLRANSRGPRENTEHRIDPRQGSHSILDHEDLFQITHGILCRRSLVESETHSSTKQPTEVIDTFHAETLEIVGVVAMRFVLSSDKRCREHDITLAAVKTQRML